MDDPIMVVLPENHPLATYAAVDPSDVAPFEWINTNVDVAGLTRGDADAP